MAGAEEIVIAGKLFEAWSSGNADAPAAHMSEDAVLYDVVAGEPKAGWPAIREFFAAGLKVWPDLALIPQQYWTNEKGVALTWVMSATVNDDRFGPEHRGKQWRSEGMSYLEFAGDKVVYEVDYHHGGAAPRSLGVKPQRPSGA